MNCRSHIALILCTLLALLPASSVAAKAKEDGVRFPMKYEGGSLSLDQHSSLEVYVAKDKLVVVQGKKREVISVASISEISYGQDVHRRVGAAVGVGVVTLGVGALLALVKTKKHYVGVVWTDPNAAAVATANAPAPTNGSASPAPEGGSGKGGIIFKVGKGEYRGFIAALEGITGKKAVNADIAGPGGTSKS